MHNLGLYQIKHVINNDAAWHAMHVLAKAAKFCLCINT